MKKYIYVCRICQNIIRSTESVSQCPACYSTTLKLQAITGVKAEPKITAK